MNKASVKTGAKWDVYVWNAFEDEYEYTWQGKLRKGTNFICVLVDANEPRQ